MKKQMLLIIALLALNTAAFAEDTSVTLKNVHLCCKSCVKGAERSIKDVEGVTLKADQDAGTITLTSSDKSTLQKAVNALAKGGYYGESDTPEIKPMEKTGAKGEKVQSLNVTGVHLCCGGCVKAVDRAAKNTPGVAAHTAKANAKTFEVTGDFNDQKFFEALQKEGLSGKIAKNAAEAGGAPAKSQDDH